MIFEHIQKKGVLLYHQPGKLLARQHIKLTVIRGCVSQNVEKKKKNQLRQMFCVFVSVSGALRMFEGRG